VILIKERKHPDTNERYTILSGLRYRENLIKQQVVSWVVFVYSRK